MYQLIYEYILNNIFNYSALSNYHIEIMNVDTNLNVWLSHTVTIIIMCLFIVFLVWFTKWLFKVVSGWFLLK